MSQKQVRAAGLLILLTTIAAVSDTRAQTHFTGCVRASESNATLIVPAAISARLEGQSLASGDEIAAYTPGGLCAGAAIWTGEALAVAMWGDDAQTSRKDGFTEGETLDIRVWDASTRKEYSTRSGSLRITWDSSRPYHNTSGRFSLDRMYVLASVTASGGQSGQGPPSPPGTPTLASPSAGATGVSTNPILRWSDVSGATTFQLQISTSSTFSSTIVNQSGITGTSFEASGLTGGSTYYWRVRAANTAGTSSFSSARVFTTVSSISSSLPARVEPLSPDRWATNQPLNLTLRWKPVSGATSYHVLISTKTNFSEIVFSREGIRGTSVVAEGLAGGVKYYWKVRAVNARGSGEFSPRWPFTTDITSPTLLAPRDGTTSTSLNPVLTWQAMPGANAYQVQVSKRSNFSTMVQSTNRHKPTSYTVRGLTPGTTYYWRVRAIASTGTNGPWSKPQRFATQNTRNGALETSSDSTLTAELPTVPQLYQNQPNPFSQSTTIRFFLPEADEIELAVYDIRGARIAVLLSQMVSPGEHEVHWDAQAMPSGLYLCLLRGANVKLTRRLLIVR